VVLLPAAAWEPHVEHILLCITTRAARRGAGYRLPVLRCVWDVSRELMGRGLDWVRAISCVGSTSVCLLCGVSARLSGPREGYAYERATHTGFARRAVRSSTCHKVEPLEVWLWHVYVWRVV